MELPSQARICGTGTGLGLGVGEAPGWPATGGRVWLLIAIGIAPSIIWLVPSAVRITMARREGSAFPTTIPLSLTSTGEKSTDWPSTIALTVPPIHPYSSGAGVILSPI